MMNMFSKVVRSRADLGALMLLAFVLWIAMGCARAGSGHSVVVDPSAELGRLDMLIGTNAGPLAMETSDNFTEIYRELGFKAVRTHDFYGPADWYTLFPDWSADPEDPASYDFTSTDQAVRAIHDGGFEILFRLGPSWADPKKSFTGDPPGTLRNKAGKVTRVADRGDFKRFAQIARHIVMHYNDGWAKGFHMGIRRWEIWNEPSLSDRFWLGTPQQFREMFAVVATSLHAHDPTLKIGGPGHAGGGGIKYVGEFVEYLGREKAPLDFFSWHYYGLHGTPTDIRAFAEMARTYRQILDRHGFASTELVCDEWGAGIGREAWGKDLRGASAFTAILSLLAWNGVTETYQYRGDDHPAGLIKGRGANVSPTAGGLRLWKRFSSGNPRRLAVKTLGLQDLVAAAVAAEGGETRVLISNLANTSSSLDLSIPGAKDGTLVTLSAQGLPIEQAVTFRRGVAHVEVPGYRALLLITSK